MNMAEQLDAISGILQSNELSAEAMVSEIGEIVGVEDEDEEQTDWADEPAGRCGNCRHCRGVFLPSDKAICRLNDPHAEPDNNEPCPKWECGI